MRAYNSVGSSVSEPKTFRTAPAAPSCPRDVDQQDATPSSLRISWLPPANDHGAPITGYQLECARSSSRGASSMAHAWKLAHQAGGLHAQVGCGQLQQGTTVVRGSWLASCWCPCLVCYLPFPPATVPG